MTNTVTGWVAGAPDMGTFTVAGLIEELQRHIEIDPSRGDDPVVIWLGGGLSHLRLVPSVTGATGHDDPEIGGHRQVFLMAHPATHPA